MNTDELLARLDSLSDNEICRLAATAIRSLQAQLEAERGARARMEKKYCEEVGIIWSEEWSKKWWG